MYKFTEGPWFAGRGRFMHSHTFVAYNEGAVDNGVLASMVQPKGWGYAEEDTRMANARLIAAAPEMFEILKDIIDAADAWENGPVDHGISEWKGSIIDILAKAQGNTL